MLRLIVIAIALTAGGGAGLLAYQATLREPPVAATMTIEAQTVEVLTPQRDLLRGARLAERHLVWTAWPEQQVRPGMVLRRDRPAAREEMIGRALRSNLYAGEPLRTQHLSDGDGGYLALMLQPQMRAVGVTISAAKTAGGFILPNDRVDVLLTVIRDLDGDGAATGATKTILTNIRVLAIGVKTFDDTGGSKTSEKPGDETGDKEAPSTLAGATATLEVTAQQAEVLLAGLATGQIALALRASEDFGLSGVGDLAMIESDAIERAPAAAPPAATPPAAAGGVRVRARQREVTIISAGSARTYVSEDRSETDD